jgi:hypothetical protein
VVVVFNAAPVALYFGVLKQTIVDAHTMPPPSAMVNVSLLLSR